MRGDNVVKYMYFLKQQAIVAKGTKEEDDIENELDLLWDDMTQEERNEVEEAVSKWRKT